MSAPAFRQFDIAGFLREHWQKSPLLIRNPWRDWANPLAPEELAGLACEPEVESRLVRHDARDEWALKHGPLSSADFAQMGEAPWTLLVQAVDHHVPEVAALIEPFRFIPDWRIDDVMVSYASDGGGVGPHYDQYDVFLVQGLGRRRWRVGPRCDENTPLLPHDSLRLLAEFEASEEWVLEPGDMLYLPPGFAHDGVAVGEDCMTYSIGFRAPSRAELVSGWTDHVLDLLEEDDRYGDPGLRPLANPGEILADALDAMQRMVIDALADPTQFSRWVGGFVTEPKSDAVDWSPDDPLSPDDLRTQLARVGELERNPASRFAFVRSGADAVILFVDGMAYDCEGETAVFAERLCRSPSFAIDLDWAGSHRTTGLIHELASGGCVAIVTGD